MKKYRVKKEKSGTVCHMERRKLMVHGARVLKKWADGRPECLLGALSFGGISVVIESG